MSECPPPDYPRSRISKTIDILDAEIKRLQEREARLAEALEPFAVIGRGILNHIPDNVEFPGIRRNCDAGVKIPTIRDFRYAADPLQESEDVE